MDDNTIIPWGHYAGEKLANIPAQYLLHLYENKKAYGELRAYIEENMDVLKQEAKPKEDESI